MLGLQIALSEITLVLFTTLAPSGTVALAIMAVLLIAGRFDATAEARVKQFLCLPLVVAMVGLVASATHLGNPSNALYVFMGVGRSPLSNEVFFAVVFLGLSGLYWLYSFTRTRRPVLERIWLVLIVISALVFLNQISLAYSVGTIITWDSPLMPLSVWLNALVGGPVLALLSLGVANPSCITRRIHRILCAISGAALALNVLVMILFNGELAGYRNSLAQATDLVAYPATIAGFTVLAACGVLLMYATFAPRNPADGQKKNALLGRRIVSCVLVFGGIFVARFAFYMLHMTVGLAL